MPALPNPGTALELDWLDELPEAVADVHARHDPAGASLAEPGRVRADTLLAIELLDLTSLNDSDTGETVRRLCARAVTPVPPELTATMEPAWESPRVAAVCVLDRLVPVARASLAGSSVRTAAVTAGFPWPHEHLQQRVDDVRATVAAGAEEIDLVIDRRHAQMASWRSLYDEVRALRSACGAASMKAILAAGDLGSLDTVAAAASVCCMAGADFVKTSTGREAVNATLPIGAAMAVAVRSYAERTGYRVGLKAAGGIRSTSQALRWLELVREVLGPEWLTRQHFRIGASSLLDDLERSLGKRTADSS